MTDVASEISELVQELINTEGLNEAQAYIRAAGLLDDLNLYAKKWDTEVLIRRLWPQEKGEIA